MLVDQASTLTERNPNYKKGDFCKCERECNTRHCLCFKFGTGCNSTCTSCSSTCENIYNGLGYFFGNDRKYRANPCFAYYLFKNGSSDNDFEKINRNDLRERIMNSGRYTRFFEIISEITFF